MDKFKVWVDLEGESATLLKNTKRLMEDEGANRTNKPHVLTKLMEAVAQHLKKNNLSIKYENSKIIIK